METSAGALQARATAGPEPTSMNPRAAAAAAAPPPLAFAVGRGGDMQSPSNGEQQQQQQQVVPYWDPAASAAKRRRTAPPREGCTMCRLRKVKCSGKPVGNGPCANCSRLELECSFVVADGSEQGKVSRVAPSRDRTEAGTVRKRAQKACTECHLHKTKCSGDLPRCKRCEANDLECEYVASRRKFSHAPSLAGTSLRDNQEVETRLSLPDVKDEAKPLISPVDFSTSPALTSQTRRSSMGNIYGEDLLAQKDTLIRHFDVFFKLWAPQPCMGIMQQDTINLEIDERRLHPIVAAAVCAMTSRIVHPGQKQIPFADRCADQVDFYLFRAIDSFLRKTAHENLVVLVCAICHFWHENQMSKVWMYMGLAARLITALQLNWDGAGDFPVRQEINRRLVWVCYILDRLLAGGFDEHLVLRDDDMHLKLPMSDEELFGLSYSERSGQATTPAGFIGTTRYPKMLSLDGYHLRLHRLRHHILGVTKRLTSPPTPHPRRPRLEASQVIKLVNGLQNQLISFSQSIHEDLRLTDANIKRFLNSPEGPSFIMLHSLFWLLHVDLYRFTIPGIREEANPELSRQLPRDFVLKSQRQAVGYAVSLARFWRTLQGIVAQRPPGDGTERLLTVDQMFAIYVIQPTKILLAARQHHLFDDLEDSTAPLVRQEPVDDAALAALVESNMQLIPPFARFFPRIMETTHDLRQAVANFTHDTRYDQPGAIGAPAVKPPENIRLPGPHYVLENALVQRETDQEDRERERQRNKSAADEWFRFKRKISIGPREKQHERSPASMTSPLTRAAHEAAINTTNPVLMPVNGAAPEIPIWLAEARGCDPLPDTPPQQDHGSGGSSSAGAGDAWMASQSGLGLGISSGGISSSAYLFDDGSWPSSMPQQTDFDMTTGHSHHPYGYHSETLLYERARGSATAAIPPLMHGGHERRGCCGDRAVGTQLPFPQHHFNDFVG
ncbi:hypothetical protein diail_10441 [Diaporthe ilicicola]|nr:hypothetical protein diail_10441 [Diaporthe ilicicola]